MFNDDLVSRVEVDRAIDSVMVDKYPIGDMSDKVSSVVQGTYNYLQGLMGGVDLTILTYVGASLLIISTTYLAYTGTITTTSIYDGFKAVGSSIWGIMSYFGFGDDGSTPPDTGADGKVDILLDKGKSRDITIYRPADINVPMSSVNTISKAEIDLPLDSAAIKWSLPDSLKDRATAGVNNQLIEVTPSSPTGSDSSDKTVKALNIGLESRSILTEPNTPNTEFFNKQQNNPPLLIIIGIGFSSTNYGVKLSWS